MKQLWAGLLGAVGVLALARQWVQRQGIIVLTLHRVLNDEERERTASLAGMIVRRQTFEKLVDYVTNNCAAIDLKGEPEWRTESKLRLAITFDDGWQDNTITAFPIARKYGMPLTIFIVARRTGLTQPFWPERAAAMLGRDLTDSPAERRPYLEQEIERMKKLSAQEREQVIGQITQRGSPSNTEQAEVDRTMTWEQIAELRDGGVMFGSHTSTHEILTGISPAQAQEEITESRRVIERQLGEMCGLFSYPNGDCSASVRELVSSAGYEYAFLNKEPGVWTRDCDPHMVPRVNVCEGHLVNVKGDFSPLIFGYTVVWSAAKGLLRKRCATYLRKLGLNGNSPSPIRGWK